MHPSPDATGEYDGEDAAGRYGFRRRHGACPSFGMRLRKDGAPGAPILCAQDGNGTEPAALFVM
jgi:hypothetical protein